MQKAACERFPPGQSYSLRQLIWSTFPLKDDNDGDDDDEDDDDGDDNDGDNDDDNDDDIDDDFDSIHGQSENLSDF